MKTSLSLLFCLPLMLASYNLFTQNLQVHNFDGGPDTLVYIDSADADNIWIIGAPSKNIFTSALGGGGGALFTDSLYYPSSDTSVFFVKYIDHNVYYAISLAFLYRMDSDTLKDFGRVYVFDGIKWLDLFAGEEKLGDFSITNFDESQLIYSSFYTQGPFYPFTGTTQGWNRLVLYHLSTYYHWWPETVLFRFEFISDSIDNNREGWMMDGIAICDYWDIGLEEYPEEEITIYPNPAGDRVYLKGPEDINYSMQLFSVVGSLVLDTEIAAEKEIDISPIRPGTYLYIISQEKSIRQRGLLVVQ